MWDLPRPGLEPVSPALASGFLTTAPQGKSRPFCFKSSARQHQWLDVALEALVTGASSILGTSINALVIHGEHW